MVIAASPVPIGLITAKRGKETQDARSREQGMDVTSGSDIRHAAIGRAVMLPIAHRALRRHLDDSATRLQDTNGEDGLNGSGDNEGWLQGSSVDTLRAPHHGGITPAGDQQAQVSDAQPPEKPDHHPANSHVGRSFPSDYEPPASASSYDPTPPRHIAADSANSPMSNSAQGAETPNSGTQEPSSPSETSDQTIHLPIFNDVAASLVRAEMDTIRRKYADAMRLLRGAPLAKVDVLVDPGVDEHWGKGHVSGGDGNVTTPAAPSAPPVPGSPGEAASGSPAEMDGVLRLAPDVALEAQNKDRKADTTHAVVRQMHDAEEHDGSSLVKQSSQPIGLRPPGVMKRGQYDSPAVPLKSWIQGRMDVLYYGTVRLGDPEQLLGVDFDTGSADLWVSTECIMSAVYTCISQRELTFKVPVRCSTCANNYDAAKSSRSSYTGDQFQVQYVSLCYSLAGRRFQQSAKAK